MKIFLTGGTGFVGKKLLKELLDAGHYIKLLSQKILTVSQTK